MERSGYDRRKRPFVDFPSDHRTNNKSNTYLDTNHRPSANLQPYANPSKPDYRGYTTPIQEYRSPRTPNTPYIGAPRYAPYDVPKPVADGHRNVRPRYPREPFSHSEPLLDKRISSKVSWQYDLPTQDASSNQICEKYERPMDPKEFKEQCRKAYLQNAQDRKRNADLSVWGKCDWAVFEKCQDCGPKHRR